MSRRRKSRADTGLIVDRYDEILADVTGLLEEARHAAARSVNVVMTITSGGLAGAFLSTSRVARTARGTGKSCSSGCRETWEPASGAGSA